MASIEVLDSNCQERLCAGRATRRVRKGNGEVDGDYCTKDAQRRLLELTKEERERLRKAGP